jgi:hypothetical protein
MHFGFRSQTARYGIFRPPLRGLFLKTTLGQSGFLCPKFQHFSLLGEKCLLDNTIFIWYSNLDYLEPVGTCCRISGSTICCYSSPAVTQPYQPRFFAWPVLKKRILILGQPKCKMLRHAQFFRICSYSGKFLQWNTRETGSRDITPQMIKGI